MSISDQAQRLRDMAREGGAGFFLRRQRKRPIPKIISVVSGRGGVGKTFLALNLSCLWALRGKKTILVDADFSMGHVDYLLGLNPHNTIQHIIEGKAEYEACLVEGPWGLKVIPGMAGDTSRFVSSRKITELIPDIALHDDWADLIVCDTTTGAGQSTMDIVFSSNEIVLVTTPETASVMDLYGMIKVISGNESAQRPRMRLIINRIKEREEGRRIAASLRSVTGRFLGKGLDCTGFIPSDDDVEEASRRHVPFVRHSPKSPAARVIEEIAFRLIDEWSDPLVKSVI